MPSHPNNFPVLPYSVYAVTHENSYVLLMPRENKNPFPTLVLLSALDRSLRDLLTHTREQICQTRLVVEFHALEALVVEFR